VAPVDAAYVQLPRHLFWVGGGRDEDPAAALAEPVDGFFWTLGAEGLVHVLLATGMRDDRPGLAVVAVPEAPMAEAERWLVTDVRPDGDDFATTLPGGDLEGLYSFTAAGEVLKLLARLFVYEEAVPHAVQEREPDRGGVASEVEVPGEIAPPPPAHEAPVPSRLPYKRVVLEG